MNKLAVVAVIIAVVVGYFLLLRSAPQRPETPADAWWGFGSRSPKEDTSIRKFEVNVSDAVLTDLQERISQTRLGQDLEDTTFDYGFQVKYMREIIDHWQNNYDWRKHEAIMNSFTQFITKIDGIDVHFIHVKPSKPVKKVLPLLLLHGWPSSVWDFHKILPMLTEPDSNQVAFEVICPSIPGYAFSEQPHKQGFDGVAAALVYRKLMLRLKHDRFYIQGGDFGTIIANLFSTIYPENVIGVHVNMATPQGSVRVFVKGLILAVYPSLLLTEQEVPKWKGMMNFFVMMVREMGYFHLQATRPDTPAFALNDSPVGLAAYILEKVAVATHDDNRNKADGGIREFFTTDEVLTNVMVYWVTGTIGSSMRFYKEYVQSAHIPEWDALPITVPAAIASFRHDPVAPRTLVEDRYTKLVQYSDLPRGGHFGALQEPQLLADDIRRFVEKVEAL